jgi:NarL family two-component system response regulator LiaR
VPLPSFGPNRRLPTARFCLSETHRIRVMIVDDHAMVRSGLRAFLEVYDDLEFAGEARDGREAVELCSEMLPDVILMDLVMPDMDGATATQAIRVSHPGIQVIALTSFKEQHLIQNALKAGAIGYLFKNVSADELASAIRAAHAGRPTLAPEVTEALIKASVREPKGDNLKPKLSDRELEVLAAMADGLTNREISHKLFISYSTVKFHVSNILSKMGVRTRTEAVAMALQNDLVE